MGPELQPNNMLPRLKFQQLDKDLIPPHKIALLPRSWQMEGGILSNPLVCSFAAHGLLYATHPMPDMRSIKNFSQDVQGTINHLDYSTPLTGNGTCTLHSSALDLVNPFNMETFGNLLYGSVRDFKRHVITSQESE